MELSISFSPEEQFRSVPFKVSDVDGHPTYEIDILKTGLGDLSFKRVLGFHLSIHVKMSRPLAFTI